MFNIDLSIPKERRERAWWIWIGVLGVMLAVGYIRCYQSFSKRAARYRFIRSGSLGTLDHPGSQFDCDRRRGFHILGYCLLIQNQKISTNRPSGSICRFPRIYFRHAGPGHGYWPAR